MDKRFSTGVNVFKFHDTAFYIFIMAVISIAILAVDFLLGPEIRFPAALIIPIFLATWNSGLAVGTVVSFALVVVRFSFNFFWQPEFQLDSLHFEIINAFIRLAVFVFIAFLLATIDKQEKKIKKLEGILPICSSCRRIRNEQGVYEELEKYIQIHTNAQFSHGVCPECLQKLYPEENK